MTRKLSTVIFLLLLISGDLSYAQWNGETSKIYSGYLHSGRSSKEKVDYSRACSLEFWCPAASILRPPAVIPEKLTYFVRFKQKNVLGKFVIKIYANDGEEYSFDPNAEGQQEGPNGEYHLYDTYLIYLILGQDINRFEIVSSLGNVKDKYVLDKLEINDDHSQGKP